MAKKEEIVAVIPAREGSSRIKDKNFAPFGGHATLIHNKIAQLKKAKCFDKIYVSSDSKRIEEITKECGADFLARDPYMCTAKPRWDDVVISILNTVPGNPHIAWAMVTSPLFTRYAEATRVYLANLGNYDSLVGVKEMREYFIDDRGRPFFYSFGPWHPYSNELKPLYAINDTVFMAPKERQIKWRYWMGRTPYLFRSEGYESIDVNFPDDLEMARVAARMAEEKRNTGKVKI